MDERLYKATMEGDAVSLISLIQQDPLILERRNSTTTSLLETPLHIAAMLGHETFVVELLKRKPGLSRELDSRRSSALHLASANGHVEIVKALLRTEPDMCSVCDRDGRSPLQIAAMMGRVDVLKEMLVVRADAARAVVNPPGGTILHLCVQYSQFEAFKLLLEIVDLQDLLNSRDRNGNTVLHSAVAHKQSEMTELLVSIPRMNLEAVNLDGMTAMEILNQRRFDARDLEMEESLNRAGAIGAKLNTAPTTSFHRIRHNPNCHCSCKVIDKKFKKSKKMKNDEDDWLDKKRSALVVVASLIATMAFQIGVGPSSDFNWNDSRTNQTQTTISNNVRDPMYYARRASEFMKKREVFYAINTASFIASLSIILLLMSGLPLNHRVFVWILMIITWISISGVALSYTDAVILLTPVSDEKSIYTVLAITVFAWICLITLLFFAHTARLFVIMVKLLLNSLSVRRRRYPASTPQVSAV